MVITFEDHPARMRVDGEQVPAVPSQRVIRIDGAHAGYCGIEPGRPVSMIRHYGQNIINEVEQAVTEAFGEPSAITQPPDYGGHNPWQ